MAGGGKLRIVHTRKCMAGAKQSRQKTAYKINVASHFGFILRHIETQELLYHYASTNNRLSSSPHQITDYDSYQPFIKELQQADYLEYARHKRPNSKWSVQRVTNVSFYVYPLREFPIGVPSTDLPGYITNNRAIVNHSHNLSENLSFPIEDDPAERKEKPIVARLVRRSLNNYSDMMYLNLHGNHFVYIADMKLYCKHYECRKCGKLWNN
ncbi:uncharacterized protein [Diadema setosum]|uniref:uncharacterized protein n=1 Tax=Diadema setosum TaxID=31175 RepID=UPI003B3A7397